MTLRAVLPIAFSYAADFVKVPRSVRGLLRSEPVLQSVYMELLARARYQAGPAFTKHGDVIDLEIGEALYGREELAAACGTKTRPLRTAIERLETLGIVTIKATRRGSIATLTNYKETYSGAATSDQPSDQQTTNRRPTDDQQTPTNKKEKKGKKVRQGEGDPTPSGASASYSSEAFEVAETLRVLVEKNVTTRKITPSAVRGWATELQALHIAGHTFEVIAAVIAHALGRVEDRYWHDEITTAKALVKKFGTLFAQWEGRNNRRGPASANGHGRVDITKTDHTIVLAWGKGGPS